MPILKGEFVRLKKFIRPFILKSYLRNNKHKKLHIGCGSNVVKGWLNCDKFNPYADMYLNVYDRYPFSDNEFDFIYSEHLIEHVVLGKVKNFLSENYRVLKPGGVMRITTPDLEIFTNKYSKDDDLFFNHVYEDFYNDPNRDKNKDAWVVGKTKGSLMMTRAVRNFFHHRWIYDFDTLSDCLKKVGFSKVIKQKYANSIEEELASMDSEQRAFETLYVDAVK